MVGRRAGSVLIGIILKFMCGESAPVVGTSIVSENGDAALYSSLAEKKERRENWRDSWVCERFQGDGTTGKTKRHGKSARTIWISSGKCF